MSTGLDTAHPFKSPSLMAQGFQALHRTATPLMLIRDTGPVDAHPVRATRRRRPAALGRRRAERIAGWPKLHLPMSSQYCLKSMFSLPWRQRARSSWMWTTRLSSRGQVAPAVGRPPERHRARAGRDRRRTPGGGRRPAAAGRRSGPGSASRVAGSAARGLPMDRAAEEMDVQVAPGARGRASRRARRTRRVSGSGRAAGPSSRRGARGAGRRGRAARTSARRRARRAARRRAGPGPGRRYSLKLSKA